MPAAVAWPGRSWRWSSARASQIRAVGLVAQGPPGGEGGAGAGVGADQQHRHQALQQVVLQPEQLVRGLLDLDRPHLAQRHGVHHAGVHAHAAPALLHGAGDGQRGAEAPVRRGRRGDGGPDQLGRRHHGERALELLELGQLAAQDVHQAFAEGRPPGIAADVLERQHRHVPAGGCDRTQPQERGQALAEDPGGGQRQHGHAGDRRAARARAAGCGDGRHGRTAAGRGAELLQPRGHAAQLAREVERGRVALLGVLGQQPLHDPAHGDGHPGRGRRRLLGEDGHQRLHRGGPLEGAAAADHLVEDGAQRELVGAMVDGLAARLLGRHVARRAHDHALARTRQRGLLARGQVDRVVLPLRRHGRELHQAEVEDLHQAVVGDHDVLGLEVAVHDAGRVGLGQPLGRLAGDVDRLQELERPAAHDVAQAAALHQLQHQVGPPLLPPESVDGDDVGMVERGGRPRLPLEAAHAPRVRHLLHDELDGDVPAQRVVARAPDLAHAALAQPRQELVVRELEARDGLHAQLTAF